MSVVKELAKIGKSIIRQLSSVVERYDLIDPPTTTHVCPYANVPDDALRQKLCELNCQENSSNSEQTTLFVQQKRLSKLQILQFIYYHFLPIDSRGVVLGINEKAVAEALNCTLRSVRNNNFALEELGLIYHSNSGEGRFNVMILPYKNYHAAKDAGGSGYLNMSRELFELLLQIKNVNALRMELRKLLIFDNDTAKRTYTKSEVSHISKNDWKLFLPKYTHSERMLQLITTSGTEAFKTTTEQATIFFVMDNRYNGKILKEEKETLYFTELSDLLSSTFSFVERKHLIDLVQLSFEYSHEEVKTAVQYWMNECTSDPERKAIANVGGYIRTLIRKKRIEDSKILMPVDISA